MFLVRPFRRALNGGLGLRTGPPAVGLRCLDRAATGLCHPAICFKSGNPLHVRWGPAAPFRTRSEAQRRTPGVPRPLLAIDPAEAEGFQHRGLVGELSHLAPLLVQHKPDARHLIVVVRQPAAPFWSVLDEEFRQFDGHENHNRQR